jgi:hypothetical protein
MRREVKKQDTILLCQDDHLLFFLILEDLVLAADVFYLASGAVLIFSSSLFTKMKERRKYFEKLKE